MATVVDNEPEEIQVDQVEAMEPVAPAAEAFQQQQE